MEDEKKQVIEFHYQAQQNAQEVIRALDLKANFLLAGSLVPIAVADKIICAIKNFFGSKPCDLWLFIGWGCVLVGAVAWIGVIICVGKVLFPRGPMTSNGKFYVVKKKITRKDVFIRAYRIIHELESQRIGIGTIIYEKQRWLKFSFVACICLLVCVVIFVIVSLVVKQPPITPQEHHFVQLHIGKLARCLT